MKKPFVFVMLSLQLCYAEILQYAEKHTETHHSWKQFNKYVSGLLMTKSDMAHKKAWFLWQ